MASSSTATRTERERKPIEPTLASTRTRRGSVIATPVAEPASNRNVSSHTPASLAPSRSVRKRKIEEVEVVVSPPKRQRGNLGDGEETDVRSIVERLQADEQALRKRELALKKREAAVEKMEKKAMEKAEKVTKMLKRIRSEKLAVQAQVKDMQGRVEALTAMITTLENKCRERNAEVITSPASSPGGLDTHWVLTQLEDQFQCSICFEVMACPYQLNHGLCGHTFCALCLLQWCFAAVHRGCGYWHDALECPLCRAELPYTPDVTPRQMCTLPFVPCRLADTTIKMLLGLLKDAAEADIDGRGACSGANPKLDDRVVAWSRNGNSRVEWESRDARGRAEMTLLVNNWANLGGEDFVALKDRLDLQ
ncbi:hypothetical protein BD311DRAFT_802384 [Dichomitus squalens]|uniref:RING-type domain-containing protein n=1 Tax=Dichomitus squalens TaxID=114155 RepID=A0A4Q9N0K6_9APHY|nr:hypothetical protein BD311DRAFT_802384 [Dichomitus squalens]